MLNENEAFFPIFGGVLRTAAKNRKKCLKRSIFCSLTGPEIRAQNFLADGRRAVYSNSRSGQYCLGQERKAPHEIGGGFNSPRHLFMLLMELLLELLLQLLLELLLELLLLLLLFSLPRTW